MTIVYETCPECNEEIEIELDMGSKGDLVIETCYKCKRKFEYYWEASIDVYCSKIEQEESKK